MLIISQLFQRTRASYRFSVAKIIQEMQEANPSSIYNVAPNILKLVDRKLLTIDSHPLGIMTNKIINIFGPKYHVNFGIFRFLKI